MVILQPEDNVKVKTVKQQACITRLLQSSYFSKREFIELMRRNRNQIITSYDASILISYLISVLRFRKKFLSKKHKAHLKCDYCGSKKYLQRLYGVQLNTQVIMCESCDDKYTNYRDEQAQIAEANSKRLAEDLAVDDKIDANHAKQDFDEEVERANVPLELTEIKAIALGMYGQDNWELIGIYKNKAYFKREYYMEETDGTISLDV